MPPSTSAAQRQACSHDQEAHAVRPLRLALGGGVGTGSACATGRIPDARSAHAGLGLPRESSATTIELDLSTYRHIHTRRRSVLDMSRSGYVGAI